MKTGIVAAALISAMLSNPVFADGNELIKECAEVVRSH